MSETPAWKIEINLNPFQRIESEPQARQAARVGSLVAAWLALGCGQGLLRLLSAPEWLRHEMETNLALRSVAYAAGVGTVLALALAWVIWTRGPRWAAIAVMVWVAGAVVLDLAMAVMGGVVAGKLLFGLAAAVYSILALRGALALSSLRRGTGRLADIAAFD